MLHNITLFIFAVLLLYLLTCSLCCVRDVYYCIGIQKLLCYI